LIIDAIYYDYGSVKEFICSCNKCNKEYRSIKHTSYCSPECARIGKERLLKANISKDKIKFNDVDDLLLNLENPEVEKVKKYRKIAAQKYNRQLTKDEVVHHIDNDHENNDPDNLMIFPSGGEHTSYHHSLRV
jgi:hypothetical protein